MSNDAATLRDYVAAALRDLNYKTWTTDEVDSLVVRAVASLYPRVQIPLDPQSYTQTLTDSTYFYALDPAIVSLSRVDLVDSQSFERGALESGTWEVTGSFMAGTASVHIDPTINDGIGSGGTLRYHGYGRYDLGSNLIPDDYLAYVVAHATSAGTDWMKSDRARFRQWLGADQTTNISVNELLQLTNDAHRTVADERSRLFTARKPMPAR